MEIMAILPDYYNSKIQNVLLQAKEGRGHKLKGSSPRRASVSCVTSGEPLLLWVLDS